MKKRFAHWMLATCLYASGSVWADLYLDDYSSDTRTNYDQYWNNGTFAYDGTNGELDYSRSDALTWASDAFLLKTTEVSLNGIEQYTVSGTITLDQASNSQPALLFNAGNGVGAFGVEHRDYGHWWLGEYTSNLSDMSANRWSIGASEGVGTYNITVVVDRSSGTDAAIDISIVGPSTTQSLSQTVTGGATFGGDQVGWWVRNNTATPTESFDNLSVETTSAIPEPGTASIFLMGLTALVVVFKRRTSGQ